MTDVVLEDIWYTWVRKRTPDEEAEARRLSRTRPLRKSHHYTASQWRFFGQVGEISKRFADISLDLEDPLAPTVHFSLANHDEYWLRISYASDADEHADAVCQPSLQGAFLAGFEYEWYADKRIVDLVAEYRAYTESIDVAIGHVRGIDAHEVQLAGFDLADDESADTQNTDEDGRDAEDAGVCLRVRVRVSGGVGEVRMRVAIDDPLAYPRALVLTDRPELLQELKAETWTAGESLVVNLVELFAEVVAAGEVAQAHEQSVRERPNDEDDEWACDWE